MGQSAQKPSFTPFGTVFQPIGFINGKPVWPVLGGAEDGAEGSSGADNDGDGVEKQDGQGSSQDGSEGSGDGSESQDGGAGQTVEELQAELERIRTRMQAADRRASNAESKVKQFEDKDKSELERAQARVKELEDRDRERDEKFRTLQLREAFRDASAGEKLSWHNMTIAMRELDNELISVEEDGTVKGMAAAVKKLAKDHSYLVKTEDNGGNGRASGGSYNGKQTGKSSPTDREKLASKFPALRGRGGS